MALEVPVSASAKDLVDRDLPFEDFDVATHAVELPQTNTTPFSVSDDEVSVAPQKNWGVREVVMVTFAVMVGGALTVGLLMARALPPTSVAAAPGPAANSTPLKPATTAPSRAWTTADSKVWVGAGKDRVAFELPADNMVAIWMRSVRPTLVVRCVEGRMDAFVFTASAARIEPHTDDHTVRFGFDDAADVSERWPDSEEHDALFAPDGVAFARQISSASVLRFGFTPHNAAPVTAQFTVAGLKALIEPAARSCGWHK